MSEKLITIAAFNKGIEANIYKTRLESEGIDPHSGMQSFIADENIVNMNWSLGNAVGSIKLQVKG